MKNIEEMAREAGMVSRLNMGAASCVYSLGCNGVTQEHLEAFARLVAQECAALCKDRESLEADRCVYAIEERFGIEVE